MEKNESVHQTSTCQTILKFSHYDAYGFDIDHTLAKYNIPVLFDQIHKSLAEYLIEKKGYGESMRKPLDPDFVMRGIVMDVARGNMLKLAEDGTILGASHGTKFMSSDEITTAYGENKHWPLFEKMIETVNNIGNEYRIFENFFDMPIMMCGARLIDQVDEKEGKSLNRNYTVFWNDLMDAIMDTYDPKHFALERGNFFPQWKQNQDKFLQKCSEDVKRWLRRLKEGGKVVFVATSSYNDFAVSSLQFIIGSDWKDYFDFFFTFARKPGFFKGDRCFIHIEQMQENGTVEDVKPGEMYSEGNSETFMKSLRSKTGKADPKVLFFGDSLRSDVFPSKVYAKWDTVLVLDEMVAERHAFKAEAVVEPGEKKIKLQEPPELEKKYLTSNLWGSFFTDSNVPNSPKISGCSTYYMNTLWGFMVRKYADIAIPQLEYVADLELDHAFAVFNHEVPLEWGFYPGLPSALLITK